MVVDRLPVVDLLLLLVVVGDLLLVDLLLVGMVDLPLVVERHLVVVDRCLHHHCQKVVVVVVSHQQYLLLLLRRLLMGLEQELVARISNQKQ